MNMNEIQLASPGATENLVVPAGTIASYDVAQGPLTASNLVNNGTIRLVSSDPNLETAEIVADSLTNPGVIESALPNFKICTGFLRAREGRFAASRRIEVESRHALRIYGGTFQSEILQLTAAGKAEIHADRIDARVHVKACGLALGVRGGDLHVAEQELTGDPLYYNGGGNINTPVPPTQGEDLSCFATGDITISGTIDTRGGDENHYGRVTLVSGCEEVSYNGDPGSETAHFECTDCSLPQPGLVVQFSDPPAGNITVGAVFAKGFSASGAVVNVGGTLTVDNDNVPGELNITGGCSLFGTNSVTIGGLVTVINRRQTGVFKGQLTVGAGENITIANVNGSVSLSTTRSGVITCGDVDGELGSIHIFAGGDFDTGGGGGGIAALQAPNARIIAGNLKTTSSIRLLANGTISAGSLTLDQWTLGPTGAHEIHVHANIKAEGTVPVFNAGGGGTNGCGVITVNGRAPFPGDVKTGAIAISNGNGDIDLRGQNIRCVPNQNGTPGLAANAGTGQIRVINTVDTDGDATREAGFLILMGGQLRSNGAIISASDTMATPEEDRPEVLIAVDKIELAGNLNIVCNGHTGTSVQIAPKDSVGLDIVGWPNTSNPIQPPSSLQPTIHELVITGSGNLQVHANSDQGRIFCSGDPLRFNNAGTSLLSSRGAESNVTIAFADSPSGKNTLVFTGGKVTVSVDNEDGDKGTIVVNADKVNNMAIVELTADALDDGDGGAITVNIDRGDLTIGSGTGAMSMSATATANGNGGNIVIENAKHNGTVTLQAGFTSDAINVNGLGSPGKGGFISINADELVSNNTGDTGLVANGAGDGDGGIIEIKTTKDITIGDGLTLTAKSTGSGNGGDIDVTSRTGNVEIAGSKVSVEAGMDGQGGTISIKAKGHETTLSVAGVLKADGNGNGRGGIINLNAEGTLDLEVGQLTAKGGATARGGRVELRSGEDLTIDGGQIIVKPGDQGSNRGGTIDIRSRAKLLATGLFEAEGQGNGRGGEIFFQANSPAGLTLTGDDTKLVARSGVGNGRGGDITIINEGGSVTISSQADILAGSLGNNGDGGIITIRAGSAGHFGTVSIEGGAQLNADAGSTQGTGGQIVLGYFGGGSELVQIQTNSVLSADQPGLGSNTGFITALNLQAAGPLQVNVENSSIRALNSFLDFNQPGQDVTVLAASAAQPAFTGTVRSIGRSLLFDVIAAPETTELVFGNVTAEQSIELGLEGGGEINSSLGTELKAPELTLEGNNVKIGFTRQLNTRVRRLIPDSPTFQFVSVRNTLDEGEDLEIQGDWSTTQGFLVTSTGAVSVGTVRKVSTNIGFILVGAEKGQLTVRQGKTINATEGSVELRAGSVLDPGTIALQQNSSVIAVTSTTTLALGNVNVHCGEPPTRDYGDGEIENVHVVPAGAKFTGGEMGLTAQGAESTVEVFQRSARLVGPLVDSITLAGGNLVVAQGEVEEE